MSTEAMRQALRDIPKYNHAPAWVQRVDNMHASQVLAIYLRMARAGMLRR